MFPFGDWQQIKGFYPTLRNCSDHQLEWAAHTLTNLASLTYLQGSYVNFEKLKGCLLAKNENDFPAHIVNDRALIVFSPSAASTRMWNYFDQFKHSL